MALNDKEMRDLLERGELVGPDVARLGASSIDLTLDSFARVARSDVTLDMHEPSDRLEQCFQEVALQETGYVLEPGESIIGQIREHVHVPGTMQGRILQRSSLVRMGLLVSSSILHPGYHGNLPLLVLNTTKARIKIYPGEAICQLALAPLSGGRPERTYPEQPGAKYQSERRFLVSRIAEDRALARYSRQISEAADEVVAEAEKRGLI